MSMVDDDVGEFVGEYVGVAVGVVFCGDVGEFIPIQIHCKNT